MPGFLDRILGRPSGQAPEAKRSRAAPLIALSHQGRALWSERDTRTLSIEGYRRNAIVYRCVRLVSEAAAAVPLVLFDGEAEPAAHPLSALLAKPNARQAGQSFLEAIYGHLLIAGNAYVESVSIDGAPRELYVLRPDRMKAVPGPDGWADTYEYTVGGRSVTYRQDGLITPPVLHLTLFDPIDDHYGFAPLSAAQVALDVHNAASSWNKALLDNAARPSGALVYKSDGANLTDEQFERLKAELEENFQGSRNAGRPILLEGGLDWKPLSLSPKDMDFMEAKNAAAREIALAFGVPPLLLGLPGDNTHANYAEANRAFWRSTIIPMVSRTAMSLAHWLGPSFSGQVRIEPDLDRIEALSGEREALWRRVGAAEFLSADEKRAAVGYAAAPREEAAAAGSGNSLESAAAAADAGKRFNPSQPRVPAGSADGGQWTGGGGGVAAAAENSSDESSDTGSDGDGGEGGDAGDQGGGAESGEDPKRKPHVSLDEEEGGNHGGHTLRDHVGKSDQQMSDELLRRRERFLTPRLEVTRFAVAFGSFDSNESANDFVNRVLEAKADEVKRVSDGRELKKILDYRFGFVTGSEAFVINTRETPLIRPTYEVRVVIIHDRKAENGFRVETAFPVNQPSR